MILNLKNGSTIVSKTSYYGSSDVGLFGSSIDMDGYQRISYFDEKEKEYSNIQLPKDCTYEGYSYDGKQYYQLHGSNLISSDICLTIDELLDIINIKKIRREKLNKINGNKTYF